MSKALITWGGWDGHEPDKVAALFAGWLRRGERGDRHGQAECHPRSQQQASHRGMYGSGAARRHGATSSAAATCSAVCSAVS